MKKLNQKGLSALELVLMIVVVGLLAGASVYFFKHQKNDATSSTNTSSQTQQTKESISEHAADSYAGWRSYASDIGNFTFKYPAEWQISNVKIDATVAPYQKQQIDIAPGTADNPTENNFNFSLFIQNPNPALESTSQDQDWSGTDVKTFQNGLTLATTKKQESFSESRGSCPNMTIVGKDNKIYYYGYPLKNKYYLSGIGGYCMRQKDITSLSYDQQINSDQWEKMILILKSVNFN